MSRIYTPEYMEDDRLINGQQPKRILHVLISIMTTISFITYMAMATGEGITWKHNTVQQPHKHVPDMTQHYFRQILWMRYVNWFLTNPLALINLALLSGLPGAHLLISIVADLVMLSAGILGTFTPHRSVRWVWFVISCVGYLTTVYQIGIHGSRAANNKDSQRRRFYGTLASVTLLVKVLYPMYVPFLVLSGCVYLQKIAPLLPAVYPSR